MTPRPRIPTISKIASRRQPAPRSRRCWTPNDSPVGACKHHARHRRTHGGQSPRNELLSPRGCRRARRRSRARVESGRLGV
ncbi:hypothetical protein DB30_03625 [Enhygromyxa salina]|uniref:Uncharacterized protein n=1 Tax=Enhygromyxa salina TaxID=215803 RepID=A0A0C2A0V3_9BACT|nr:hypothetical protein DB30_03625 [Enhygromyxa salina]